MRANRFGSLLIFCAALALSAAAKADHRDAPTIGNYSAIGINDLYMFRDPSDHSKLVVALTTQALASPLLGPTYHFQPNARYRFYFTRKASAAPNAHIDFVFGPYGDGPHCPDGPACQTYTATFSTGLVVEGFVTEESWAATHNPPNITTSGSIKIFAGPREDPSFFDRVGWERASASGNAGLFTGVDAFKGMNVNAIVVEMPVSLVFQDGCPLNASGFAICGAWAVSYLGAFDPEDVQIFEAQPEGLRQVDRIGNPAVKTLLIPPEKRDSYSFGLPSNDAANFSSTIAGQISALDFKFGRPSSNPNSPFLMALLVPDILRFNSFQADGWPNGRMPFDHTTDILISLVLELPGFADGTQAKHYCLPSPNFPNEPAQFPFLGPPLQLSSGAPFTIISQSCP